MDLAEEIPADRIGRFSLVPCAHRASFHNRGPQHRPNKCNDKGPKP